MTAYIRCHTCGFFVINNKGSKIENCPNCGIPNPYSRGIILSLNDDITKWSIFAAVSSGIIGGYLTAIEATKMIQPTISTWWSVFSNIAVAGIFILGGVIGLVIFSIIGVGLFYSITRGFVEQAKEQALQYDSLWKKEKTIASRLSEINDSRQEINKILRNISELEELSSNSYQIESKQIKALKQNKELLEKTDNLLQEEHKKYTIKSWDIELIRWLNNVEYLICCNDSSMSDYDKRYEKLKKVGKHGMDLLNNWKAQKDLADTSEGKSVIQRTEKSLQVFGWIIIKNISNQTNLNAKRVSPIQIVLNDSEISLNEISLLNTQQAFEQFLLSLKGLEEEHMRIESEFEAIKDINVLKEKSGHKF